MSIHSIGDDRHIRRHMEVPNSPTGCKRNVLTVLKTRNVDKPNTQTLTEAETPHITQMDDASLEVGPPVQVGDASAEKLQ